jgi:hypothetical protein
VIVWYSRCRGRPPGEHKRKGNTVTWACWWSGNPKLEHERKPDAYGGAPTKGDVEELVRQFAARTAAAKGEPIELKPLSHSYAFGVRDMIRGGPPPSRRAPFDPGPSKPWPKPGTPEYQRRLHELYEKARLADEARWRLLRGHTASSDLAALGLSHTATEADVRRAFRRLALKHHPDRGGSEAEFKRLNGHYQAAMRLVGGGAS